MDPLIIIVIVLLVFSIILHELAHGYAALYLGDPTARIAGRLTLNPIPHIDLFGSILLPGLLVLTNAGFLFGWAKPVPYNPHNLRNERWGEAFVAFAGPGTNILIALIFGLIVRFSGEFGIQSVVFLNLASYVVLINIVLALFNLIPFPPLDGSKVISAFLPHDLWLKYQDIRYKIESLGLLAFMGFLLIFMFVLSKPMSELLRTLFVLITGEAF